MNTYLVETTIAVAGPYAGDWVDHRRAEGMRDVDAIELNIIWTKGTNDTQCILFLDLSDTESGTPTGADVKPLIGDITGPASITYANGLLVLTHGIPGPAGTVGYRTLTIKGVRSRRVRFSVNTNDGSATAPKCQLTGQQIKA